MFRRNKVGTRIESSGTTALMGRKTMNDRSHLPILVVKELVNQEHTLENIDYIQKVYILKGPKILRALTCELPWNSKDSF